AQAEQLCDPENSNDQLLLAGAYFDLKELPAAIGHLEKHSELTRQKLQDAKLRLTTNWVEAARPADYSEEGLAAALRQRLSNGDLKNLINPLSATAPMREWAQELTLGATNQTDKSRRIFDALSRHGGYGARGTRTAQEGFAAWNRPRQSFSCEEYAKLF